MGAAYGQGDLRTGQAIQHQPTAEEAAQALTDWLRVPGGEEPCGRCRSCVTHLRPLQAAFLAEAHDVGGILGPIKVGGGKIPGLSMYPDGYMGEYVSGDEVPQLAYTDSGMQVGEYVSEDGSMAGYESGVYR